MYTFPPNSKRRLTEIINYRLFMDLFAITQQVHCCIYIHKLDESRTKTTIQNMLAHVRKVQHSQTTKQTANQPHALPQTRINMPSSAARAPMQSQAPQMQYSDHQPNQFVMQPQIMRPYVRSISNNANEYGSIFIGFR